MSNATTTLTGHDAIAYAAAAGLTLSKHTGPTEDAREGLTVDEAREIAAEDPSLIYVDVDDATEHYAQAEAARVLRGRDESSDWRAAGYTTARRAAEALVGSGSGETWERTVQIVVEVIA